MKEITATFEKQNDETYKLHCDSLNADLGVGMKLSQIAAATKGDLNFSDKLKKDVEAKGVKADDDSELTQDGKSDISWSASGDILVPSTVELYYNSEDQFSQSFSAHYVSDEATYANYTYNSPANNLSSADASHLDPEIGSIAASMVPWEAQTASFRAHYLPADGRSVDKSMQYYVLIDKQRPAGEPDLAVVNVPDLRGEFLRGLNSFDKTVGSSSVDPFDSEKHHPRVVGEEEDDAVQQAEYYWMDGGQHTIAHARAGGDAGAGDHFSPRAPDGSFSGGATAVELQSTARQSSETRPRNRAVFYYVRVN